MKAHNIDLATARILSKEAYRKNGGSHPQLEDVSTIVSSASLVVSQHLTLADVDMSTQPIADPSATINPALLEIAAQSHPETMELVKEIDNMPDLLDLAVMATLGSPASTTDDLQCLDSLLDQQIDQHSIQLDTVVTSPVQSQDPFMGCTYAPTSFQTLDDAIDFL